MTIISKLPFFCFTSQENTSIPDLVHSKSWGTLRKVLSKSGNKIEHGDPVVLLTILHVACRLQPPVDIVKLLNDKFPASNSHPDHMGQYPIHLAAEWGASPRVIDYLVNKDPLLASLQDKCGKTPLHCFCQHYAANSPRMDKLDLRESMFKVINTLSQAAPLSLLMEDFEGFNAVEYALESNTDNRIVRRLQKRSEHFWKEKQKIGVKHEEIWNELRRGMETNKEIQKKQIAAAEATVALFAGCHPHKQEKDYQSVTYRGGAAA
mmetsp:Transcript_69210/g.102901  ORF Transcript_69210/g.102901 Transcript_69210/m.102901 type:complete len:264 (-) Transcript_69210:546-1337(-)